MTRRYGRRVAILGGNRIPFARANGPYARASNQDMLTTALEGLVQRFGLAGERLGEVAAGAVLKHSTDHNLTRESVLGTSLAPTTPAFDVQQACATSLQATVLVANKIALGQLDSAVAGGTDSASDAPLTVSSSLGQAFVQLGQAHGGLDRARVLAGLRPADLVPVPTQAVEPRTGLSMGQHMAATASDWGITRQAQDRLAVESHQRLAAAYDRGFFDDLLTPYLGLTRDGNLRPEASVDKLGMLPTVFGKGTGATMTAGNSTPLTDGASAVLLGSEDWAAAHGLTPLAWFVDAETAAVDYVHGREGMLMAPVHALPRLLERTGLALGDFDLVEIHEAFAATVLTTLAAWESPTFCRTRLGLDAPLGTIERDRLNVNGSSLAAGHPFAATGARVVASLAKALHQLGSGFGLISVCAAGGQGMVAILEAASA
ncbi:MAG: acetyl-CoA C-acetyltransferase [Dermatophilaceae bacterium]